MQRITFIDGLKTFAIFLVVWGHTIQHLRVADFFHNHIFEFIYSFHMPLFFLISGFFFASSRSETLIPFLKKKTLQLILPGISWFVIFNIFNQFGYFIKQPELKSTVDFILQLFDPHNWLFWFLKELFLSYVIVYLLSRILKKDRYLFIACLLFVAVMPEGIMQRFLMPFFLTGIAVRKHFDFLKNNAGVLLLFSFLIFVVLLFFWDGSYTIYVSYFPKLIRLRTFEFNTQNLDISFFRFAIGLAGSMSFFLLFHKLLKKNTLSVLFSNIGKETMGIYILQFSILEKELRKFIQFNRTNDLLYNLLITPLITAAVVIICYYLVRFIKKSKYLSLFLVGNYSTKK